MLTSLDRDESQKKFSGSRKKFLHEKFLDPQFALQQMWALKCLRTRCDVFVLCRRLTPAASSPDCCGLRRRCWCLIAPPTCLAHKRSSNLIRIFTNEGRISASLVAASLVAAVHSGV